VQSDLGLRTGPRCNIGPAEICRRRWIATVLTAAAAALAISFVALGVPHLGRVLLWPFAAGAVVTWLQVTRRFCVRYGAAGLENFGEIGGEQRVPQRQVEADRRRALQLLGEGILAGLVITVAFVSLPV